ncbi:protein NRT1/ PTR FAMILY 5.5 [Pistacia vera]|uniref:protein NRT1/ PTR FAMILY 5.5 n=1 Tax=Pistacia vera TaxID=55513 RepID=UPI001262CE20|nr:protein NRT1/ PTR FAMILY 5.5 [Pistacia vera]
MLSSFIRITVLMWADFLAAFAIWMMMTYLTNVWKIGFTHAAVIVNFFWGIVLIMPLALQFLVDTIIGNYWMLLLSSFAYSAGLSFLAMSTPPVMSEAMGTCSEYKLECIGEGQKILFYTALALTAYGMSGHITSIGGFMGEQITASGEHNVSRGALVMFFLSFFGAILVPVTGAIAIPLIHPWSIRFGIPAICTVVATLIFLTGTCSYRYVRPEGSSFTSVFRVFVASASKIFHRCPKDATELYERDQELYKAPPTRGLRCLDKAAIILADQTLEEQERNRWRLCSVTEVEETKSLLRIIPICLTFILLGVLSSVGFSYFLAQADHLNRKVGHLSVPIAILLWFYDMSKKCLVNLYVQFANWLGEGGRRYAPAIGIAISMVVGILCLITAAKVEIRRLDVIRSHGLIDRPDDKIPMTMFWLLPQFVLLGGFDGISQTSAARFLTDQFPATLGNYMAHIALGIFGLGTMGSVLSVYVVGIISERGGKPSWFQDTLNKTRLDKYYWTLAAMTAVNLVVFILVAIWYAYKDATAELEAPEFEEAGEPFDDNARCCCCC